MNRITRWNDRARAEGRRINCNTAHDRINQATGQRTYRCDRCSDWHAIYTRMRAAKRRMGAWAPAQSQRLAYEPMTPKERAWCELKLARLALTRRMSRGLSV